ncbi:phytanoyl-CoA dioxygenase family protein [Rubrivivax gelatinosus]|uniref:phytanoyl-CoA dioxygenase family protein n=1 Tax=Rubrivivax gelatinosus TaxID=28068 RepID=UPI0002F54426|nr:phytanoyl-CoA dioxygenase family protein [Rubrivivax gelatinosus]MBG6082448.1 ectoine hydroxylase-related dioxygenase (phytanoyl-CoA dioxygenase family) [Rubrivivax gelatinosus]
MTSLPSNYLPSPEDVTFYREHGWFVCPKVLPDDVVEEALYEVERYYSGERDRRLPISGGFLDWRPGDGPGLRLNDYVSLQSDGLRAFVLQPVIGAIASTLCGDQVMRLFHDQLINKPPAAEGGIGVVGWHTDKAYWETCTSSDLLTAWIPLQDTDEAMGPIAIVDGSHRWPQTDHLRTFRETDLDAMQGRFAPDGAPLKIVPLPMQRGQLSFHHCRAIHGSRPNLSGRNRISLTIHIQDGANRYKPRDADTKPHINEMLCRPQANGMPDYTDPDICPVLTSSRVFGHTT